MRRIEELKLSCKYTLLNQRKRVVMKEDLQMARVRACSRYMKYGTRLIMSMVPVQTDEVEWVSSDEHMRLYWNEKTFDENSIEDNAWAIIHEAVHIFCNHARRKRVSVGERHDPITQATWGIAADLAVNDILQDMGYNMPKDWISRENLGLDKFPTNETVEEYFKLLDGNVSAEQINAAQSSSKNGQPQNGSSATGIPKKWEQGGEEDSGQEGVGSGTQDRIRRQMSHDIEEAAKNRGSVPNSLMRTAKEILKPSFDPRKELLSEVRYAVHVTKGFGQSTWRKPSRRPAFRGLRTPANIQPVPRPLIIIDTSGSMGESDLGLALGVIAEVVAALPSQEGVRVISGDTRLATCKTVFSASSIVSDESLLQGGGGTDMGAIMVKAAEEYSDADVMIVVTDGYTPWPSRPLPMRCLALYSGSCSSNPPSWIKRVNIAQPE